MNNTTPVTTTTTTTTTRSTTRSTTLEGETTTESITEPTTDAITTQPEPVKNIYYFLNIIILTVSLNYRKQNIINR